MAEENKAVYVPKKKKYDKATKIFIITGIMIPIIQWLIFYIYCNASAFVMAFTNKEGVLSFANFTRIIEEFQTPTSDVRIALANTLFTFVIIFVSYPFQVLVSYFLYKKVPGTAFYRIVFFIPGIIFSVAVSMVFKRMVDVNGIIAQTVGEWLDLGYAPELLADSRFARTTCLLEMIWLSFPGSMIIWGGTFARIPEEVLESARIDGVTWWQEFTKIIVPLVWPTVALQMILLICGIFGADYSSFLLTGGQYETITLSSWMYLQMYANSGANYTSNVYNYMSACGLCMTVIAVTLSLFIRKFTDRAFNDVEF